MSSRLVRSDIRLDSQDADIFIDRPWYEINGYAKNQLNAGQGWPNILFSDERCMHRVVMAKSIGRKLRTDEWVDHINHDRLDNRRGNLRICTVSQNHQNRTKSRKYVGVYDRSKFVHNSKLKWIASITHLGQNIYIGLYKSQREAAWMRDQWALAIFGEFATLNFKYMEIK